MLLIIVELALSQRKTFLLSTFYRLKDVDAEFCWQAWFVFSPDNTLRSRKSIRLDEANSNLLDLDVIGTESF
jgi:hypothetical protein